MKKLLLPFCFLFSFLFGGSSLFGATQTYNISLANLINCPTNCGTGSYYGSSGQGFTWTDVLPAGSIVSAVSIQFNVGVECSPSTRSTSLNSVVQGNITTSSWCSCSLNSAVQTISASASNYTVAGANTFVVNGGGTFGFCPAAALSNYYAVITVTYTSCTTPGTPVSLSGTSTGQTTANLSWAAGSPAGSATVTYYWFVSTNPAGVCGTTTQTFNYSGAITNWTVPAGVTSITVDAYGAQGGTNLWGYAGGLGARTKGTVGVTPGQVLKILVGGQGGGGGSAYTGGGGGGSFVTNSSNSPLIIAGGGGGSQYYAYSCGLGNISGGVSTTGKSGIYDPTDFDGDFISCTTACGGGAGPAGGGAACMSTLASAGGGGLTGNGTSYYATGGSSFTNGGAGGAAGAWGGAGGFGGGGGSYYYYGGGGGGGYGGGSSGEYYGEGGGGGSYNGGTNQINTAGAQAGNGVINITYQSITGAVASGSTTGTTASATGLSCNTSYYLTVYAYSSCGAGSQSACGTSAAFTTSGSVATAGLTSVSAAGYTPTTTTNPNDYIKVCPGTVVTITRTGGSGTAHYWGMDITNYWEDWDLFADQQYGNSFTQTLNNPGIYLFRLHPFDACGPNWASSSDVYIEVSPIDAKSIGANQTICSGAVPAALTGGAPTFGALGTFTYQWMQSVDNGITWANASGTGTNSTYTSPALTSNTLFKRNVLSNGCSSTSGEMVSWAWTTGAVTGTPGDPANAARVWTYNNSIKKADAYMGGVVGWNSGAISTQSITNNGGYVEAILEDVDKYRMLGLGNYDVVADYSSIEYAIYPTAAGTIEVYESGVNKGSFGTYAVGDKVKVSLENNQIKYYKNTTLLYTSATAPTLPLYADVSLYSLVAGFKFVKICNPVKITIGSTPPTITAQPANATICTGSTAALSVTATGTAPLTYQWQSMASNCATPTNVGTNSPNYTTAALTTGTYYYNCIVTNSCGSSTSNCAVVTVNAASVLGTVSNTGPIDFCSAAGNWSTDPISVSGNTGTITWDWGSSNGTWNNGWTTGTSPLYATFPKKVAASDANADRIRWSVTNGVCPATGYSSTILLRNHYNAAPTSLTANANIVCVGSTATLTATFASAIDILGTVEFSTSCGGAPFATVTPGNNVTAVTATVVPVSGSNNYYARFNPGTGTGCSPSTCASQNIIANMAPTLPASNTSAQTICSNSTANLSGNNPAIGTGSWSIVSGPSTAISQIANPSNNTTTFTPAGGAGNYVTRWTIDNLPCSSQNDDATVVVVAAPTTANAGANLTMCATGTQVLAANNPSVGTGVWDILSGPSTNTSQLNSTTAYNAIFDPISTTGGTYILEWRTTSSAPCAASTSTMSVTSNPAPTTSNAGSNQTICSNSTATLAANNPAIGVGGWSVSSGPSTLSTQFSNTALRTAVFTPAGGAGTYVLTWTISNAPCSSSPSNVSIIVIGAPTTSNAGSAQSICTSSTATLTANNPTVGTGAWTIIGSSPSTNISQLSSASAYNAVFTPAGGSGVYTFHWTITSSSPCATSASNVLITVNSASTLGSVSDPGPIDFCDAGGDWSSAGPISVSGHNGTITWDRGASNGTWQTGWTTGTQPLYTGIPKKVAVSDGNYDRIRWSVQSAGCAATGYSATILLRNNYNEAPASLTSNPASACATAATTATLTATFPAATNILGSVEFSTSCGGAPFATVAGNGTTTVKTTFTTPGTSTTYFASYIPPSGTGCSASPCVNTLVIADAVPVLGSVSNAGPIDFCSATGDWSTDAISLAGSTGVIWWQYGSSNGTWSADWVSGLSPNYTTFPKKVAASDANPDRVRWYVKSTNGGCTPTSYSSAVLLRNHYNENPTSISSNINNICSGVAGTLTVTFPTATNITGTIEFATSCGGAAFATISGNGTTTVATAFTAPATTTTYYARYNPGAGTGCSPGSCVNTTVTVLPPAPATPGIITGTVAQCPSVTGLPYSIVAVANATSYTWTVPTGWVITSGSGTNAITVTSGIFGQNGNITVTATNSCGTSAAAVLAVNTNGCLPAPSMMVFPTNANVFVTIANSAVLTMGNPSTATIANAGVNGAYKSWIVSEGQGNCVQWNDIVAGTYVIPFGYSNTDYIPFTFTKTSAGSSNLNVSTWGTPSSNTPWATATNVAAVTNMYSAIVGSNAAVPSVVDRWWTINTTATANMIFSYRGAENTTTWAPTGTFAAQHWNGTTWDAPVGSGTGVTSGIGTVTVTGASTFSPWVVVTATASLPVQWLDLAAECNRGEVIVKWSTASEQNADYFTVERSLDGTNFTAIATVLAAGNSSTIKNYSSVDKDPYSGTSFYRIRETDFNSSFFTTDLLIVNGCANDDVNIYGSGSEVVVGIDAEEDGEYTVEVFDILAQKILSEKKNVTAGSNRFKLSPGSLSSAIYVIKVFNSRNSVTKKVFIRKHE